MISVDLSVQLSEPEPVIPTALHTSPDCNEDQMHERPGNCETLSNGRDNHIRCIVSGFPDQLVLAASTVQAVPGTFCFTFTQISGL